MDEKKKVLFSFVGMRDPYSDGKAKRLLNMLKGQETLSEGSVLTACRQLKPDLVYLFPSSKEKAASVENQTEDRAEEAREIIIRRFGVKECSVMPLMTENAADHTNVYSCLRANMKKAFRSLTKNYPGEQDCINKRYELIFILSSGTQQMNQAAQLYLSTLPYEFKYFRCIDPKHGSDRVKPMQLTVADETVLLKSIEASAEGYHFYSVIEGCEKLLHVSILKMRRGRAQMIKECFTAYEQMDLMHYEEAYKSICDPAYYCNDCKERILEEQPGLPIENISGVLNRQVQFLNRLKAKLEANDESEDEYNLVDLYYNMKRAYARGNYADVLARFWRLREGMMNYRLLKYYHIDRRNINRKFSGDDERERTDNIRALSNSKYKDKVDWNNGWLRNDIGALSSILTGFFEDTYLNDFEHRFQGKLERLRNTRNQTIVAHGMLPVSKKDADDCISLAEEVIKLIPGGSKVSESYPFKLEDMREVLNLLKYI